MSMFDQVPDTIKDVQHMNQKLLSMVGNYVSSMESFYDYVVDEKEELEDEIETAEDDREEACRMVRNLEEELRILGRILSEQHVEIPLSGHTVDLGQYLPESDERRFCFDYEELW